MLVSVLASPGDHAGLWGIAWSGANGRPTSAVASDPRTWASQVALWEAVGASWAGWLKQCVADGKQAQFVVAETAAMERVVLSARKVASSDTVSPVARSAARAFIIAGHASKTTGQQSVAPLTSIMREHFVSGADPLDERHLGLWAAWPTLRPGWDAPHTGLPLGADSSTEPIGKAWDKMVRHKPNSASSDLSDLFEQNVATQVRKLVIARWEVLRSSVKVYMAHPGRVVSASSVQHARESRDFCYLMTNERLPATRSQRSRWTALADRELAASEWQTALWREDSLERARGAASGDVLVGTAQGGDILTTQAVLRVRPGDKLTTAAAETIVVRDLIAVPHGLVVETSSNLSGPIEAWPAGSGIRPPVPEAVPWTHDPEARPVQMPAMSGDLLAAVEALKSA